MQKHFREWRWILGATLLALLAVIAVERLITIGSGPVYTAETLSVTDSVSHKSWAQTIAIRITSGPDANTTTTIVDRGSGDTVDPTQRVSPGQSILVAKNDTGYYMTDWYRLPALFLMLGIFLAVTVIFGRIRGLTSLFGLMVSVAILMLFVVPAILAGANPLLASLIGGAAIAAASMYLSHGLNARSSIALAGMLIALVLAVVLSLTFVSAAKLTGYRGDETFYLQLNSSVVDLHGLILAGIIIALLGILDDATIGQAAAVHEISVANPSLGFRELLAHGISIGREHIASLVNSIALVYAGTSLPLFLLIIARAGTVPLPLAVNSEVVAVEIVRAIVGSITLIVAVPLTTLIAAYYFGKIKNPR